MPSRSGEESTNVQAPPPRRYCEQTDVSWTLLRTDVRTVHLIHAMAAIVVALSCKCSLATVDDTNPATVADRSFPAAALEFFESRVRPILIDRCIKCHGPEKRSSGLRLDSREGALEGGDSGPAIVPLRPDDSLLIQAVAYTHTELKMPPSGKLAEPALTILRQWVSLGAPWSTVPAGRQTGANAGAAASTNAATHWAFQPINAPGPACCQ